MGTKQNKFTRAPKRTPHPIPNTKAVVEEAESQEAGELLGKLSTAIALVETVSFAMQTCEDEPDLGSIATSLELACCKAGIFIGLLVVGLLAGFGFASLFVHVLGQGCRP
jgi:hypothetical protein